MFHILESLGANALFLLKEVENLNLLHVKAIRDEDKTLIIVSNEVGMSIVPSYRLGRIFSDISGKANQDVYKRQSMFIPVITSNSVLIVPAPYTGTFKYPEVYSF